MAESCKYSQEQLFVMGKTNYERLVLHCQSLEVSGFWEQAKKVMNQSSTEVLDLYVQSVLMELAIHCGNVIGSQMEFIQTVPISNPLGIAEDTEINKELKRDVRRIYNMPPVLIQLCSLYDQQNGDDMTEYFIDALLNILLCMVYLNGGKDEKVNDFIQKYYNKISYYVIERTPAEHVQYMNRKLLSDSIECEVEKKEELREQEQAVRAEEAAIDEELQAEAVQEEEFLEKLEELEEEAFQEETEEVQNDALEEDSEEENDEKFQQEEELEGEESKAAGEADNEDGVQSETVNYAECGNMAAAALSGEPGGMQEKSKEEQEAELSEQAKAQFLLVKKRIQERELAEQEAHEQRIKDLMDELNGLVGLENVKQEIQSLINLIKIRKLREKMKLPAMEMSYHMVFTGSPGTGKTTVARLVAKIYKELGILSEGNLVETDRSGLVAGYVGQTAIKVHEIVEQAIGGILFIDEAYALTNPDVQNDFGTEAIDTLVKLMEDHRDNLVIIVAGYTEEMQNFLKSNTGLISRFNKFIDFPDYSKEELVEIMGVMAENAGLTIEDSAKDKVFTLLEQKTEEEWATFGNARGIRNMFEKFIMNQANRLVMVDAPTKEDLIWLKEEDVCV